ncbi:hypothetical protein [Asticcacaulis sp.]|uniref:hypothetical protein n=1 Tax=Asticcacaulis sp. TaxID=1872648 RepID=UPI003F7C5A71
MRLIGLIDPNRIKNIPFKHQAQHEFCFHLHDLMAQLLVEMEANDDGVSFNIETEEDLHLFKSGIHPLDFLAQSGREALERRAVINHMSRALYADMLHFIYEGLIALEKRKFSVAFALLRKPFKEGMLLGRRLITL